MKSLLFCCGFLCSLVSLGYGADALPIGWGVVTHAQMPTVTLSGSAGVSLPAGTLFNVVEDTVTVDGEPAYLIETRGKNKVRYYVPKTAPATFFSEFSMETDAMVKRIQQQRTLSERYAKQPLTDAVKMPTAEAPGATSEATDSSGASEAWGIISVMEAATFTKDAKAGPTLGGGTCFKVLKTGLSVNVTQANGESMKQAAMYIETFDKKPLRCILLQAGTCQLFQGGHINAEQQAALVAYYSAIATRDRYLERQKEKYLATSPAKGLAEKKRQLAQVPARDRALEAKMNAAKTAGQRLKYRDARKELKYETIGLQDDIKRLQVQQEQWAVQHPFDEAKVKKSAVYQKLNQQVERLKEKALPWLSPSNQEGGVSEK